jgi:DNA uptake protein ComE-like DNA-binding protein
MKLSLVTLLALPAMAGCALSSDVGATSEGATTDTQTLLDFVNDPSTDLALLDKTVKLDSRAATGIVAARAGADGIYPSSDDAPFANVAALDAVPYVGSATIAKLQAYALAHPAPASVTVEGVSFSGWQAQAVVWGVNHAAVSELDGFLDARAAKDLVLARPFASVAQTGPVSYVGPSALTALRGHAAAWWTASQKPACAESFVSTVTSELGNLLFMSESDRPFDVVSFPGAGTAAPTAASVLALVNAPSGSTALLRPTADYYAAFEADDAASAAVQATFAADLTDVVYVAVFAPEGSENQALVDVYLVGRTSCGDLVGLHSIAVET